MGTSFDCPHCGGTISTSAKRIVPVTARLTQKTRTFESTKTILPQVAPAAIDNPAQDWQRVTPIARLIPTDIITSLLDSLISFSLATIGAVGIVWFVRFWFPGLPLFIAPAVGFTVGCWRYFNGMDFARGLLEIIETLEKPQQPEKKEQEVKQVLSVEMKTPDSKRWQFADLPGQPAALREFAQRVVDGVGTFSERTAVKCRMTQGEFSDLSDLFVDKFWAVRRHPTIKRLGVNLTQNGKSVLRAIASSTIPSPESFDGTHAAARKHKRDGFFV